MKDCFLCTNYRSGHEPLAISGPLTENAVDSFASVDPLGCQMPMYCSIVPEPESFAAADPNR
ncbi:hypothetical protein M378DRAFT_160928 [Amanita muscaria Koide BX008]|uniref:Uncharacterized protein n=1 Tax=Amanita muscaria (strain Koide BX008) TaxID=946122 RepID=A0A0C2WXD3_AMAMK|nr:hypothetical protein M378DRAFT_160928 [Amanita muscaria Koide BX008]